MSEKLWMGGIYLKEEGGYEIILKSLIHYKKRLQTIHQSPELKEAAAMFAPLLQSTARKKIPVINEVKEKMEQCLLNLIPVQSLEQDLEVLQKALECRKADIIKAEETGAKYFINLLEDVHKARKDLDQIEKALIKINQYSE
ncbi:MAG: hypothetical protein CXT78_06035 [Thaumarchaeota archaeon]|jgi:hypothetical protein|nr:MAG: hypothetical protein CXT78_06035 [Nitrososphaerota archaeon]